LITSKKPHTHIHKGYIYIIYIYVCLRKSIYLHILFSFMWWISMSGLFEEPFLPLRYYPLACYQQRRLVPSNTMKPSGCSFATSGSLGFWKSRKAVANTTWEVRPTKNGDTLSCGFQTWQRKNHSVFFSNIIYK
jgi:hypothetical protein